MYLPELYKNISGLPRRIHEAFKIATSGRPGPVLVGLPNDVTAGILKAPLPFKATTPGINIGLPSNPLQMFEVPTDAPLTPPSDVHTAVLPSPTSFSPLFGSISEASHFRYWTSL